jgi:hypothetical protein
MVTCSVLFASIFSEGRRGKGELRSIVGMTAGDVDEINQAFINFPSLVILSSLSIGRLRNSVCYGDSVRRSGDEGMWATR